jgi:branched-chain amino acid transport system permease protein
MILGLPLAALQVIMLNAMLALSGYAVIAGGSYSFAFVGFYAVGAYTGAYLSTKHGIGTWGEIGVALVVTFVISLILGRLLVRLGGIYLAMATVAITAIVGALAINLGGFTGGAAGITGVTPSVGTFWLIASVAVLCLGFYLLNRSRIGMAMRLVRSDRLLARSMGVNDVSLGIWLFVLSSMIAAFGGVMYAHYYQYVAAGDFTFTLLIDVLAMIIIGGSRHWLGPVIGAAIITAIPDWLSSIGVWAAVITGGIVLLIILFAPDGVVGAFTVLIRRTRVFIRSKRTRVLPPVPLLTGQTFLGPQLPHEDVSPHG